MNGAPARVLLHDFSEQVVETETGVVYLRRAGDGPAVLLLHGFPQTHVAWHLVAPALVRNFTVVAADLPGYGRSSLRDALEPLTKRAMGKMLSTTMRAIGLRRWSVVGHDRGARVAYRMALDEPEEVLRLAVLDIVPTLDMMERCSYDLAAEIVNWFFLAQPAPLPERMIEASGDLYVSRVLDEWLGPSGSLDPVARSAYLAAFRNPASLRAVCNEYRASTLDAEQDREDRAVGRKIACPVLTLWSAEGLVEHFFDPLATWRHWATDVRGRSLATGHFLMEQAPTIVSRALIDFLA